MANTKSAKKAARRADRRQIINAARKSRVRGFIRKVEEAILGGEKTKAVEALRVAESEIMRGVGKNVVHKNTAARKVSRLSKRVKALAS
jgi:small subunit ribosomal protein S20